MYCFICHRGSKNEKPSEHRCYMNWNKSATGMEADDVVEGFMKSVEVHNLKLKN